ncbi:homoserine kinase [Paraferrimonas sp. SM1919]|uniref:homoserine kinase n=1 Tax=Paraferrimonas sp. SM1919 TaxID=2662263 RepID=UPI0013CFC6ED|nr:homoserine kinase [Paraferrimonas sp. SM1919]
MKQVVAYAPASMGNVSVGFDLLGAAVAPIDGSRLGDRVTISESVGELGLHCEGPWAHKLPLEPKDNIVLQCIEYYCQQMGFEPLTNAMVTLEKNLPVGSGLGSSASSVVAALCAVDGWFDGAASQSQLLHMMGELEGRISGSVHYDNVAPSYLGGMQLMSPVAGKECLPLPSFDNWYWVLAYSGVSISTAKMRALMPTDIDMATTIEYAQNLAGFVHACHRQDEGLALALLKDCLAEPYRAEAIPGFTDAKAQLQLLDVAACGISGSGPTVFAVTKDLETAKSAAQKLQDTYLQGEGGFVHICKLDTQGTVVEKK